MTPLFCDVLKIESIAPQRALDKLARKGFCVYDVQKVGPTCLKIRVKSKETEKIFAIFRGSCYTVTKIGAARLKRVTDAARKRFGILVGAAVLLLISAASNFFVLDIEVVGSGARYRDRALELLAESGIRPFALYGEKQASGARAALLTLPCIVFAEVEKSGCVVTVTLEESAETPVPERSADLLSPASGVVEELTVLRGTPLVKEGDEVEKGQKLVGGAYETESGERFETFAVARCSLLHTYTGEYKSNAADDEARRKAVAAVHLRAGGELVEWTADAREEGGGFIYTVTVRVRLRISVNL